MESRDDLCEKIEKQIGRIIFENKSKLTDRDIIGILEHTKFYFIMIGWEKSNETR
jgi:hypothetical protein